MKLSEIKEVKNLADDQWREAVEQMLDEEPDFEVNDFRFIHQDSIDKIQQEELSDDEYILGCFNDWFLADILGINFDTVQTMQKKECFEALGKLVIDLGKLEELQEKYAREDGYGHHFSHYDGYLYDMPNGYYAFRMN